AAEKKAVLFVCLGNICRSPACEGICRDMVGDKLIIDSAATSGFHVGQSPDTRSQKVCKSNGVDISKQRARQITKADFSKFDVIAALDQSILSDINSMKPSNCRAKVVLFNPPNGVDDPYYSSDGFPTMFASISKEMKPFLTEHGLI
uniref:protein tyrosine phosphatase n=1 Tax=Tritrichomonas foetus TaxID=56690 RepID=UPI00003B0A65|nr:Chain A, protein tyrosine phosphatase [Tritrichomonas suis]